MVRALSRRATRTRARARTRFGRRFIGSRRTLVALLAAAALAVRLEEFADNIHSLTRTRPTLEREAQQIHAEQPLVLAQLVGERRTYGLIATNDTMLIGAHLAAP